MLKDVHRSRACLELAIKKIFPLETHLKLHEICRNIFPVFYVFVLLISLSLSLPRYSFVVGLPGVQHLHAFADHETQCG